MEIQPNNPKDDLISKLCKKEINLSYSSLKSFSSPVNFINYKLKKFTSSPSMVFGSLCDVLLLTPEKFKSEFLIIDKIPESELQIGFSNALIELIKNEVELTEDIIKIQFDNYYKRGDALKTYEGLKDYINAKASGKELITQDIYVQAKAICDNLMLNEDIQLLFSQIIDVQFKVKYQDRGWNFIGFLDMLLDNHIIDLKFSKDSNPDKFERDIANYDYFLQAAMYCKAVKEMGICENPKYSFIVFDKSFNYSIIELDYSYIMYGERKYNYLLQELDRCIAEGSFEESYGFFKRSYKVYKPKWAKGFATDEINMD